jgi:hypothetical protein
MLRSVIVKFAIGFAVFGFTIATGLCGYAFYLSAHHLIGNTALFLILCPPSLGAIGLDNAGVLGGIIGWLIIAIVNLHLYAAIGIVFGMSLKKSK